MGSSFFPVTTPNVGIISQTFFTFSFDTLAKKLLEKFKGDT